LPANADFIQCRQFQLNGLFGWKTKEEKQEPTEKEYSFHEVNDIFDVKLEQYANDLQAILINFPWAVSNKDRPYNFELFVF